MILQDYWLWGRLISPRAAIGDLLSGRLVRAKDALEALLDWLDHRVEIYRVTAVLGEALCLLKEIWEAYCHIRTRLDVVNSISAILTSQLPPIIVPIACLCYKWSAQLLASLREQSLLAVAFSRAMAERTTSFWMVKNLIVPGIICLLSGGCRTLDLRQLIVAKQAVMFEFAATVARSLLEDWQRFVFISGPGSSARVVSEARSALLVKLSQMTVQGKSLFGLGGGWLRDHCTVLAWCHGELPLPQRVVVVLANGREYLEVERFLVVMEWLISLRRVDSHLLGGAEWDYLSSIARYLIASPFMERWADLLRPRNRCSRLPKLLNIHRLLGATIFRRYEWRVQFVLGLAQACPAATRIEVSILPSLAIFRVAPTALLVGIGSSQPRLGVVSCWRDKILILAPLW